VDLTELGSLAPRILFEDTHLIVLSKPAGLLSQGDSSGDENLVDYLRKYLGRNYVGLVHRLDRNTSGIMIVAKRTKSAQRLTDALQKGKLKRSYLAFVEGTPPSSQTLEHYLLKNEQTNEVRVVSKETSGAKASRLEFKKLAQARFQSKDIALLYVTLETGRGHQIRVQCSAAGYPLLGDQKYKAQIKEPGRPALHSYALEVPHPMSQELLSYKDLLPVDLQNLIPEYKDWP
jgi:23S rRNA pseudouridine1911/1915/1917 synthase